MHVLSQLIRTSRVGLRTAYLTAGVSLLAACLPALAQPPRSLTPPDLEAAYLYNFGKFVNWPEQPAPSSAPFAICTLGNEDFSGTLDSITLNESMQGRRIAVRRLPAISAADGCHILFLASSEEARLVKDLDAVKDKPILTVSSLPAFLDRGGMIQFIVQDKKVRFSVNLSPAVQAHLMLSSQLLKVAVAVHGAPAQEAR